MRAFRRNGREKKSYGGLFESNLRNLPASVKSCDMSGENAILPTTIKEKKRRRREYALEAVKCKFFFPRKSLSPWKAEDSCLWLFLCTRLISLVQLQIEAGHNH